MYATETVVPEGVIALIESWKIHRPTEGSVPLVVSVPHCGSAFPEEVRSSFLRKHVEHPEDTDWFVEQLYDFVGELGITLIHSHWCRYVIDLNRDPESKPLYDDGRVVTELVPVRTFLDEPLYENEVPAPDEIQRRLELYYWPYHRKLGTLLAELQREHGQVLLWEAHSIQRFVPTIHPEPFPDLILGNQCGATADSALIEVALRLLKSGSWEVSHNEPFRGGYITRSFGRPTEGVHALQLEMAKDLYMDEETNTYLPERAEGLRKLLKETMNALIQEFARLS